ncbi:MAG: M1 family peptidase, partial [Herminiimonas sp.]|nr:M1 family peptidase [Herminiimonas sp.]
YPDLAFDFAVAHRTDVDARVDANSRSRFYPSLANTSADATMVAKVDAYARAHLAEGSRRDAETAKAEIAFRIKVRAARLTEVDAWLPRS